MQALEKARLFVLHRTVHKKIHSQTQPKKRHPFSTRFSAGTFPLLRSGGSLQPILSTNVLRPDWGKSSWGKLSSDQSNGVFFNVSKLVNVWTSFSQANNFQVVFKCSIMQRRWSNLCRFFWHLDQLQTRSDQVPHGLPPLQRCWTSTPASTSKCTHLGLL